MAISYLHKRSSTQDKRPTAASLDQGELALNLNATDPGAFFEDASGNIIKLGPVTVSATAPNSSPATGGSTGNSVGEQWLDTSVTPAALKIWDGSNWVAAGGGSGTPGGNDTEVQFNNAGSFDGDANFTFNAADDILSVTEVNGRLDGAVIFIAESGEALSAGDVVYVSGVSGNFPVVSKAQANSASTMPAFGLVQDAAGAAGVEVRVTTFGDFTNFDTSTPGWSLGDTLYVSAATAGELTNSAPAGESNLIQNIGKVGRVSASVGRIKVGGAGRTNATPNLNSGNFFLGNASNQAATVAMSGDATMDNTGALTIANDAVTTVKILDDAVTGDKIADNVALAGSPTTTTQTAGTNNTTIATTAYVDTSAGTKLDTTLNDTNIFVGNASNVATGVSMSGDATIANTGALTIANDAITTAKILDDAVTGDKIADNVALAGNPTTTTQTAGDNSTRIATTAYVDTSAGTKLDTTLSSAQIFVGNVSNVATGVAMSGDATIDNSGSVTIANGAITSAKIADDTIVNADINSSAAIDYSKLAAMTAGNVLLGNSSNVPTVTAISGDVTLSNTGVVDIIDDVALGGNPTTTTQADTDNSTRIATTAFVQNRVDLAIQGLNSKQSVRAASTGDLTLSGTQTVDGVALSAGDRVLVKDQSAPAENGIYDVATGAWTRSGDVDTWDELVGAFTFVESGTTNADAGFVTQTVAGGTLGTDAIPWVQFSGAGQITAGDGMTKTGNTLDVVTADATRIAVSSDSIDLATTGIAANTYRSLTVDAYGRATSGTNPTTFAGYAISDTSANLAAAITDETGTGSLVFSESPDLTGSPTAPTQTAGTSNTTIATTAFVGTAVSAISTTYVAVAGDTMTGALILDDTTLQIQEGTDTLTLGASALTADRAVNFQDAAGDIALVGAGTVDTRYVAVAGDTMTGALNMTANILPTADNTYEIGSTSLRFANIYSVNTHAGDLHLTNERGSYTLIEEEDALTIRNNKTGKVYNILMEERV